MVLVAALSPSLEAKTRKGEKLLKSGREAEGRKQWETALDFYEQAILDDPGDPAYQLASRRVRYQAAMARVDAGQKLRSAGKLEEALAEFQKAYAIDPSSSIAEQEIRRTREMMEREKSPATRSATPEDRGLTPAEKAQRNAEEKASRMLAIPELQPLQRQISTLKMNNQPVKVLYETVGKLAGINVIFDAEYQNPPGRTNFTVDLSNTTLEEALDYLAIQTKSYWKPLSANTIFVTNDNVTKRRDYEDYVVKVFYVKNATTVQELQEISTTVRSVTEIRRAFTYNAGNAILVRGTADQVALAEKLIQDLDKPKAEVVVDVMIMEANRQRIRDLAATITTAGGAAGINLPISYSGGGTTGTGSTSTTVTSLALNQLDSLGLGDFSVNVPGGLVQALMSDSQSRLLQSPQVRAVENFKAQLRIGDKVPYATGSFQPGIGTAGLNPLVSTQFSFLDVGVNVDITPKVHGREEVSLHVEVELSSLAREVDVGGLKQPVVSRRAVIHDIRLKEGEANLLGGLLGTQEVRSRAGIPYLMDIPGLGRLFGTEKLDRTRGELMIVLLPRIVRAPDYSESNLRPVSAGNDQNVKVTYAPRDPAPAAATPAPTQPVPAPQATPPQPAPPAATPAPAPPVATPPAAAAPAAIQPVSPPPAGASPVPPPAAAPQPNAAAAAAPQLLFAPGAVQAQLNSAVTVTLQLQNVTDLFTAPLRIRFDPKVVKLTAIRPGTLMSADGQKVNFTESTLNDTGEAVVTLNRLPGTGGITGSGNLLNLLFQAVGRGKTTVAVVDPALKTFQLQPITAGAPAVSVAVQ